MEQKLYSPTYSTMYEYDWNGGEHRTELSKSESADYADKIELMMHRENKNLDLKRGLMEYYGKNDTVNTKVESLFINVEVINNKLW